VRRYTTGQFARRAAVSVRALRFYDRAGVLAPSGRTEAGYRVYTDADFPRLQQVLALKFLGLSLDEIKRCLAAGPRRLQESLGQQKAMMREKRAQLDAILRAIDEAERQLQAEPSTLESVVRVIEVIQRQQNQDWVSKYLTPEQQQKMQELSVSAYSESARQKLAARGPWTEEDQQRASEQWAQVGAELKRLAASGADRPGGAGVGCQLQRPDLAVHPERPRDRGWPQHLVAAAQPVAGGRAADGEALHPGGAGVHERRAGRLPATLISHTTPAQRTLRSR
jgi:DNA-binding transcriptional MerR regulator